MVSINSSRRLCKYYHQAFRQDLIVFDSSSLGVIAKLFGLWFSLFLFFGILWLEVFALTKWGSGENVNQNYQSLSRTLVMMAFMSTG